MKKRSDLNTLPLAKLDRYLHLYHLLTGDYGEDTGPTEADYLRSKADQAQANATADALAAWPEPRR